MWCFLIFWWCSLPCTLPLRLRTDSELWLESGFLASPPLYLGQSSQGGRQGPYLQAVRWPLQKDSEGDILRFLQLFLPQAICPQIALLFPIFLNLELLPVFGKFTFDLLMWGKFCAEFFSSLFLRLNIGISPVSTSSPDSTLPSQPGLCPQLPCWHCFLPGHQRLPCQTSRILLSPRLASLLAVWDMVNGPLCLKSSLGLSWVAPHSLDFLARSLPVSSEGFFSLKNDIFLTLQWSTSFSVVPVATSMLKTLYILIFCLFPCVCLRPMCPIVCQAPAPADFMLECFLSSCVSCFRVFYHSPSGAWKPGQLPLLLLLTSHQSCVLCLVAQLRLTFCDPHGL